LAKQNLLPAGSASMSGWISAPRGRDRSGWGGWLAHPHKRLKAAPGAPSRRGDGESPSWLRARSGVGGSGRGSEEGMTSRAAPGGQGSGLGKAGGQDDFREVPHKVHVFSRCPNVSTRRSLRLSRAFGRHAFASCLGHLVRSIAARLTRSCRESWSTQGVATGRDRPLLCLPIHGAECGYGSDAWPQSCGEIANRTERP
jgi:hypothetical protein